MYDKQHLLKMDKSMHFDRCIQLRGHHHNLGKGHFSLPDMTMFPSAADLRFLISGSCKSG